MVCKFNSRLIQLHILKVLLSSYLFLQVFAILIVPALLEGTRMAYHPEIKNINIEFYRKQVIMRNYIGIRRRKLSTKLF